MLLLESVGTSKGPRYVHARRSLAPNMCITFFGGFKHKIGNISITKMIVLENSSDLERGGAPRSIAVEFFETIILVIEI